MHIYNITFIVNDEIEKDWVEHIDRFVLPEIRKNVYQIDLLKIGFQEGLKNVKGKSFSVQIYCNDIDMVKWVKDIGSQMILQKLQRRFKKDWTAFASTLEFVKTY